MSLQADRALRDAEILDAIGSDASLLAIVDAIHCTQQRPPRRRRARAASTVFGLAALLAAVLGLVAPWRSDASVASRALTALGTRPVIRLVTAQRLGRVSTLELASGRVVTASSRSEVLFDAGRRLERVLSFSPLTGPADELHTATGDWLNGAPVPTCSWIAAHPAAAAREHVSCPPGSSTRPQPPTIDRALAVFASGYRAALRSGKARPDGDGTVAGRPVHWLAIGSTERVAVDVSTLLPVLVRARVGSRAATYRVLSFETVRFVAGDFARSRPPASPAPTAQSEQGRRGVGLAAARIALGGRLALLPASADLRRTGAQLVDLVTAYGPGHPARRSSEVELVYRTPDGARVLVREALRPNLVAGFAAIPARGEALLLSTPATPALERADLATVPPGTRRWQGVMRAGSLYLTVDCSSKGELVRLVRMLSRESR